MAILDRGIPGRELIDKTAILLLRNTCDAYALSCKIHDQPFSRPSEWMSGKGKHRFQYALLAHNKTGPKPVSRGGLGSTTVRSSLCRACPPTRSEMLWRLQATCSSRRSRREGDEIELRMVECLGQMGSGSVEVKLPHSVPGKLTSEANGARLCRWVRSTICMFARRRLSRCDSEPRTLLLESPRSPASSDSFLRRSGSICVLHEIPS